MTPFLSRSPFFGALALALYAPVCFVRAASAAPPKPAVPSAPAPRIRFNRDIRPILSDNCFFCHGPDKAQRQADLRLDRADSVFSRGVIAAGNPAKSLLIQRVSAPKPAERMPPPSVHKTLTAAQIDLLKRWIAQGAHFEVPWAYAPLKRPAVPVVPAAFRSHARNAVDAFILAKLSEKGIAPSPEADKRTLIRRVSLDLIGLPPTPEEVSAFLADRSPNAYEKVVDRLLSSPHYGERMAAPWLDVVRYADTVGFHGDQNINAWPYRDYVIDSFNRNRPFDQFTIQQIAGDLLPNPTPDDLTATAFNRLNMVTREGGAQDKEYLAKSAADRVRTVSMCFLGSTMGCCECHDHKYDPFSQKDFYALAAFFADVKQWGIYADYGYTRNPELRGFGNDHPFPPEAIVPSAYLKAKIARDQARIDSLAAATAAKLTADTAARAAFTSWRAAAAAYLVQYPDGWAVPTAATVTAPGATTPPALAADGSVLHPDGKADHFDVSFAPAAPDVAAIRVEALPESDAAGSAFVAGAKEATLTLTGSIRHASGMTEPIHFRYAWANRYRPRYSGGSEILGVQSGWTYANDAATAPPVSVWLPDRPIGLSAGDTLTLSVPNKGAARVRFATTPFAPADPVKPLELGAPALATALAGAGAPNAGALRAYLLATGWDTAAFDAAVRNEREIAACRGGMTPVVVARSVKPMTVRVLPRGNWQDETGEIVTPAVPHFLPQPPGAGTRPLTRLDLAKWLVSPQNPLTARVFVNRLWRQFFGNGISGQVEDLGAQGEWPSHPELLDYLASSFRDGGWNVKQTVRLIVTSATYRQSSQLRPELRDIDPGNRLLASQNPRRLEAEFVRDNALAISGLLTPTIGGPPAWPYQPAGYYASIQFPDRDWTADKDESQYRRGVYMHWQRTFLHPMLANFDAPSREDCTAARTVANTPHQALTLLNDPEFVECARVFAANLMANPGESDAQRLEGAYQRALCRSPRANEKRSLLDFVKAVRAAYRERPEDAGKVIAVGNAPVAAAHDPVELATWTTVCRVILNLHETITRY